jgi:glycosyltransferase A (GT-A) superfamily protein (DUF2064 family)
MRRDGTTAVILFTGDVRREERRKQLPRRLLASIHTSIANEVRRAASCDLYVCGSAPRLPHVRGTFPAGARPVAEQISTALATLFDAGYARVIVLAGDVAALHARHVAAATRHLRGSDRRAVLGPCRDGGFYLAAFNQRPDLEWDALPWFSGTVASELSRALTDDGFALDELERLDDVDDVADAHRIAADRALRLRALILSILRGQLLPREQPRVAPVRRLTLTPAMRRRPPPLAA